MMSADLFDDETTGPARERIADGAVLLRGFCVSEAESLIQAVGGIAEAAPFRHLVTPGGFTMSVAMTNCGCIGWVSDRRGYRYDTHDPTTGQTWPGMPAEFADLAVRAAAEAGFALYRPESCLINRYAPGARLSLHQDRDEHDYSQPIVSVSLGLPATFLFGGLKRTDRPRRLRLVHGDVAVWGGPSRLAFHGIAPLADGVHPVLGATRINLTFRTAL
jgi:alkylated DNA repair protein (DNA oxidative demethylase)